MSDDAPLAEENHREDSTDEQERIKHDRTCDACGATTFQYERCHICGDIPWKPGDAE